MKKTNSKFYLALIIFSLIGQVAWVVENMYLNVFIYKMFNATAGDISLMVALSAVTATLTTVFMGALSDKIGKRNKKKDDNHLNKHAMHLVRLFMMAIDILEKGEIRTHRTDDLELLKSIRRGDFQKTDGTYQKEFYDLLSDYEKRLELATVKTTLPDNPDMEKVEKFVEYVNRKAIEGDFGERY